MKYQRGLYQHVDVTTSDQTFGNAFAEPSEPVG